MYSLGRPYIQSVKFPRHHQFRSSNVCICQSLCVKRASGDPHLLVPSSKRNLTHHASHFDVDVESCNTHQASRITRMWSRSFTHSRRHSQYIHVCSCGRDIFLNYVLFMTSYNTSYLGLRLIASK